MDEFGTTNPQRKRRVKSKSYIAFLVSPVANARGSLYNSRLCSLHKYEDRVLDEEEICRKRSVYCFQVRQSGRLALMRRVLSRLMAE
jgi:hypothetical protein